MLSMRRTHSTCPAAWDFYHVLLFRHIRTMYLTLYVIFATLQTQKIMDAGGSFT